MHSMVPRWYVRVCLKKGGSTNIIQDSRGDALQLLNGTNLYIGSTGLIQFEGSTADAYETNPYSSRTHSRQNYNITPIQLVQLR